MSILELLTQSPWADRIGWVLVHSLWQFALVALLAVVLQWTLKRRSATTRYSALLAAMFVMVAVPVATWFSPWSADAPVAAVKLGAAAMPESILPSQHVSPSQHGEDEMAGRVARPERSDGRGESQVSAATPFAEPQERATQRVASGLTSSLSLVETHIQPWLPQIVLVWFAGVLLAAFRPLLSWYTVLRLKTKGVSPVAGAVNDVLERTAKRLGLARAVELLQSALVKTPVVVGYFRPAVLLPLCVVTGLPESQLELILAHELAHIRRHDYLINLLQTLVETLFFYHPAVWWLSRQIRNERENCCDDVAMATVGNRADYGRALLAIEELRAASATLTMAACGGSLLARIRRIAGCEPAPRIAGGGSILCVVLASIAILAAVTWGAAPTAEKPAQAAADATTNAATDAKDKLPSTDANTGAWKPGQVLDFRVINARTKEPLPGVKLELQFHGKGINFQDVKIQTTDAQGRSEIRLPDLRPDAVRVYPSKPGFVPLRVYWGDDLPSPTLPKAVTVPLEPGTVWGGVNRNEQGKPIPGAKVTVHYWESPVGNWQPHRRANIDEETTTDKDGRWRIDVMPAEVVEDEPRIFLSHPDYVSDHLRRGMIPMPVTQRPTIAALRAQTAVMVMRKGGVITGRVIGQKGRPLAGARIYNEEYYWLNSRKPAAITGNDGRFRITNVSFAQSRMNDPPPATMRAVEQGEVALVVQAPGYTPELIHSSPDRSASPLEISLKPGQAVHGRVVDENGKPLQGVHISVDNWLGYRARLNVEAKTDADGRFRLTDTPLSGVLYGFYKKGYTPVQDFPMSPQPTGQPGNEGYQVTLKAPLTVAGSFVDAATNQPPPRCAVIKGVEYDDGRAPEWQRYDTKTITDGQYEFEFASSVFCWRIRVEAEGYMPAVSRIFRLDGSDKGRVICDFKLLKAAPVIGTVLGPDGKPLANAEVFRATNLLVVSDRKASSQTLRDARMARTDAAGRFELPPEVEPFYLVVLHDQGYAVLTETEFAKSSTIRVKPWTGENSSFRVERRPSSGQRQRPDANAKRALTVRVVDADGKPVEGAHVATYAGFHVSPNQFVPYESGWSYSPNIVSDRDGVARIADPYNRCVVARHVERKLVAVRTISPGQMNGKDVVTLTVQPQCVVSGRLTAKEMEARNRKIAWTNVYVYLDDGIGRPMSCMSDKADYHFYLPPGTFTLDAYGTDTQHVRKTITVKPGQEKLDVDPIDLPPTGLVLLEGKPAPELRDIVAWRNGGPVKLSDLRGKVVILAFSSGWDGRGSIMPELFPLYDKHHDQGLVIIEIRLDMGLGTASEAKLNEKLAEVKKPFWKDRDVPIPIALVLMNRAPLRPDAKAKARCPVLEDFGITGFPTGVLIDRQGRVAGRFDPRRKPGDAVLEKVFKEK